MSIAEILRHPYLRECEIATKEEVEDEMNSRRRKLKRASKEEKREARYDGNRVKKGNFEIENLV